MTGFCKVIIAEICIKSLCMRLQVFATKLQLAVYENVSK